MRISAVSIQVWAVVLAVVGILALAGAIPHDEAPGVLLVVVQYGILAVGAVWLAIVWFGRSRG